MTEPHPEGVKHITLDRVNMARLGGVLSKAAVEMQLPTVDGLDPESQRAFRLGYAAAGETVVAMAPEMPVLYGDDGFLRPRALLLWPRGAYGQDLADEIVASLHDDSCDHADRDCGRYDDDLAVVRKYLTALADAVDPKREGDPS